MRGMSSQLDRASLLLDVHRPKEAAKVLLDFLATQPNHARGHAMLARCFLQLKKYRDAEQEIEEAIRIAPEDAYGYYIDSYVLWNLKRLKDARDAIDESLRLSPTDADYFAQSANLWNIDGNYHSAIRDARRGLESDPCHLKCECELAYALMFARELNKADQVMKETLIQHPDTSLVHATYGWIAINTSRYRLARTHFLEALRIDPNNRWAEDGLLEAYSGNPVFRFIGALDIVPPDGIGDAAGVLFWYWILYAIVWMNPWMNPWEPTRKFPTATQLGIVSLTVTKAGLGLLGLFLLMGASLGKLPLMTTKICRSRLKSGEYVAAFLAWTIPLVAIGMMVHASFSRDRAVFAAGCVLFWGAVPLASIGRFQAAAARSVLGMFSIIYFVSGTYVVYRVTDSRRYVPDLDQIVMWHVVIALCMPLVIWMVTLFEPKES
jgi:tetratricopeptide (TPR) repeat protein